MVIKDLKITKKTTGVLPDKQVVLTLPFDGVLFLTDFRIIDIIKKKYSILVNKAYIDVDEFAIQPMILDRTIKNPIQWINGNKEDVEYYDELLDELTCIEYESIYDKEYLEPTIFASSLSAMIASNNVKEFNIVVHHNENVRKIQIERIVDLLGPTAYRANIIIADKDESFVKALKTEAPNTNTIVYPYCDILPELESEGFDLDDITLTLNEVSYNFEEVDGEIKYRGDILGKLEATQIAIGYIVPKKFQDLRYFTVG